MPVPDADRTIAGQDKICGYLLNLNHPLGGHKAEWFASWGYELSKWRDLRDDLRDDLLEAARMCHEVLAVPSPFGVKCLTKGRIGRLENRAANVIAVWIIEGNSPPRLITTYSGDDECLLNILSSCSSKDALQRACRPATWARLSTFTTTIKPMKSNLSMVAGRPWRS